MNRWILDYICCPVCKEKLQLSESVGNETEVLEGILTCTKCERTYPIADGIADLLPKTEDNTR